MKTTTLVSLVSAWSLSFVALGWWLTKTEINAREDKAFICGLLHTVADRDQIDAACLRLIDRVAVGQPQK
jgi:hypothetical protein